MESTSRSSGSGLGKVTTAAASGFVVDEIRKMSRRGAEEITVHQERRWIKGDAISVDGKWYRVDTSPMNIGVSVTCEVPRVERGQWGLAPDNTRWIDESGRII